MITSDLVREYFEYKDGKVYWKKSRGNQTVAGDRFGCLDSLGYQHGTFQGKRVREHQLVWLMFQESLPYSIDHLDGNRTHNLLENLRAVSQSQNAMNSKLRKDNKTGCKGVFKTPSGAYAVSITVNRKIIRFGTYKDFELACLVADEARDLYHGAFARHN